VDEVEKMVRYQNRAERHAFVDSLRYSVFDGNCESAKTCFYRMLLTIHPYVQELLLPHWEASGLDRFAPLGRELAEVNTIYFQPMPQELAKDLVAAYLVHYRLHDHAEPFTDGAITEAINVALCVPGRFLKVLHEAVEYAAEKRLTQITDETIRKLIDIRPPEADQDIRAGTGVSPRTKADLLRGGLGQTRPT
jgi:hypothetical protein